MITGLAFVADLVSKRGLAAGGIVPPGWLSVAEKIQNFVAKAGNVLFQLLQQRITELHNAFKKRSSFLAQQKLRIEDSNMMHDKTKSQLACYISDVSETRL